MAISPYLLTTRELPAMAAALLGERVLTALPTPPRLDKASVRASLHASPRSLRVLERWAWCGPLFRAGIVRSLWTGEDPIADARRACASIADDQRFAALRRFLHDSPLAGSAESLDELCGDLLKGGPDPGLSIPVHAGLDAIAHRHGLTVVRQGAGPTGVAGRTHAGGGESAAVPGGSLAQRAEEVLGQTVCSVAIPVFTACGGRTLLEARELLEPELRPLRAALSAQLEGRPGATTQAARHAARQFADAFASEVALLEGTDDDLGERITIGMARLTCRRLPADAVLASSTAALRQFQAGGRPKPPPAPSHAPPGPRDAGPTAGTIGAIVVTPLLAAG